MKLKDVICKSKNNLNKQSVWNPKKRKLKKIGLTEEDLLNINLKEFLK